MTVHPIPRPFLGLLAGLLASQLALSGAAIWVSNANARKATQEVARKAEEANQQWCQTLRVFRESYAETPPTTEAGRKIRDGLNRVYEAYHCDQVRER